jgi:hypothetical protein
LKSSLVEFLYRNDVDHRLMIRRGGNGAVLSAFVVVAATLGACGAATDRTVDDDLCGRVRAHFVDLRLRSAAGVDAESHRAALTTALGTRFIETCKRSYSYETASCLLAAADEAAARDCRPPQTE